MLTPDENIKMLDSPTEYRPWRLAQFTQAAIAEVMRFIVGPAWSLFLFGAVGTRKSSLASAVLRQWRACGHPSTGGAGYGEFITPDRFDRAIYDFEVGKFKLEAWRIAPVLVVDDILAGGVKPRYAEQLLFLLCARYDCRRPVIVTCNHSLDEVSRILDPRIASRLSTGIVLDLGDRDSRQGVAP